LQQRLVLTDLSALAQKEGRWALESVAVVALFELWI
jgi:hypothetical protein